VAGQHLAHHRAGAIDQVEHARRQTGLVDHLGEDHRVDGAISLGLSTTVQPAATPP
jgi:hypothetical protein